MEPIKVDRNSFTYKIFDLIYENERYMPKSRCGYTWTFIFALLTMPLWTPSLLVKHLTVNSIFGRLFVGAVVLTGGAIFLLITFLLGFSMIYFPFMDVAVMTVGEIEAITHFAYIGYIVTFMFSAITVYRIYPNKMKSMLRPFKIKKMPSNTTKPSSWTKVCKPIEYIGQKDKS